MIAYLATFLAGAIFVKIINWIERTKIFAKRPLVVSGNHKDGYRLIHQRPFSFFLAAGTSALYDQKIFGSENFLIRLVQRYLRVSFQNKCNPCSTENIIAFADSNGISHHGWEKDIHEYKSVDEFFTRKYAKGKLVVKKDSSAILAPSEGTVVGFRSLDVATSIWIKQKHCTLKTMGIPDKIISKMGERQNIQVFKLDVYDLHRYYSPISGRVVARIDHLEPLRYSHSVRPVALKAGWDIMTENRRVIIVIEHNVTGEYLVMMIVGGIGIDSVEVNVKEGANIEQGEEIGMFHMGGSAILIATPASDWKQREDIEVASVIGVEVQTRIGDIMMKREKNVE